MPRGFLTDPETMERIIASYAETGSISETARQTKIPKSTVARIVRLEPDQFTKLRTLVRLEIIEKVWEPLSDMIDQVITLIPECKDLDKALNGLGKLYSIYSSASSIKAEDAAIARSNDRGIVQLNQNTTNAIPTGAQIAAALKLHRQEKQEVDGGNGVNSPDRWAHQ